MAVVADAQEAVVRAPRARSPADARLLGAVNVEDALRERLRSTLRTHDVRVEAARGDLRLARAAFADELRGFAAAARRRRVLRVRASESVHAAPAPAGRRRRERRRARARRARGRRRGAEGDAGALALYGWRRGDFCLAAWEDGLWYPGRVAEDVGDGTYDVVFSDGDFRSGVRREIAPRDDDGGDGGGAYLEGAPPDEGGGRDRRRRHRYWNTVTGEACGRVGTSSRAGASTVRRQTAVPLLTSG
ncbi:hypothetical protein JL721_12708 [Aureococcus anophagefferens]|nr:hypothetical protein JL721_12708 [Aureococcus anophagefferens]